LDRFRRDLLGCLIRLVTMNKTWIHIYNLEPKEQSKEWRHSCSLGRKNSACILPGKVCNITEKYYAELQTEAATGLQTSRQAFERNLISSRQCCSSRGGNYAP
jgi:hypothetical protein